jgi:hypothetical protein
MVTVTLRCKLSEGSVDCHLGSDFRWFQTSGGWGKGFVRFRATWALDGSEEKVIIA